MTHLKLGVKHLLVTYMQPYEGDLAELDWKISTLLTFVAFVWPFGNFFQLLSCYSIRVLGGSTTESQLSSCYWHLQFAILGSKIRSFTSNAAHCVLYPPHTTTYKGRWQQQQNPTDWCITFWNYLPTIDQGRPWMVLYACEGACLFSIAKWAAEHLYHG